MKRIAIAALGISIAAGTSRAQSADDVIDEIAIELEEAGSLDEAACEELAEMGIIADEPLDLNSATSEELGQLIFLSESQTRAIVRHREKVGRIVSEQELMSIGSLSASDIYRLLQFTRIGEEVPPAMKKNVRLEALARTGRRWPESRGVETGAYPGTAWNQLFRLKGEVGKWLSVGMVGQNDAGEPQMKSGAGIMDFGGGYVCLTPKRGIVTKAVVGNYHVRIGQGLGAWTGFMMNPTAGGISAGKTATGISPTMSAAESGYRRGAGVMMRRGWMRATAWASATREDGSIKQKDDSTEYVSTIRTDGLHRTEAERERRHNIRIASGGIHASGDMGAARIGAGYNVWHISTPIGSDDTYLVNRPQGKRIGTASMDVNAFAGRAHIFGEAATQGRDAWGGIVGVDIDAGGGTAFSGSLRRFGRRYYAANGNPSTQTTAAGGEGGATIGTKFQPLGLFQVSGIIDYWVNHWLRYDAMSPTGGWKWRIVVEAYPNRRTTLRLTLRHTEREKTQNSDTKRGRVTSESLTRCEMVYGFRPSEAVEMTTMAGMASEDGGGKGYMVSEGVKVAAMDGLMVFRGVATYFNTDNYACRVYGREPRMMYDMRFSAYSGEGIGATGMVVAGPWLGVRMWVWASYLWQKGRETLGSGNDETMGAGRGEVRVQVVWRGFGRGRSGKELKW